VAIGEIVVCEADVLETIDLTLPHYFRMLRSLGVTKLARPERIVVFSDHEVPAYSERVASLQRELRRELKELGVRYFYDMGRHGISHQSIVEHGHVLPGMLAIGADTHATTLGCVGALAPPVNYEAVQVLATGDIWLKVPETIRIVVTGEAPLGVLSRDIAQWVIARLGAERCDYRVLEYAGPAMAHLDMDARMTLCNVAVDIGAKSGVVEPDELTREYLAPRAKGEFDLVRSDPDAVYELVFSVDLGTLEPMVAAPPSPDNVVPVSTVAGIEVDQVYIGSCAGGRLEDLRAAAAVLEGRTVHPGVRMIVVPTSQEIFARAAREGLVEQFINAGAAVTAPNCGPCYGNLSPLAEGEVCVGTGTRNEPGRMGNAKASIYLANAATAATAAVLGKIADPRELMRERRS
jgi:3-isopropylmalate/(R)-2-methylmalate dehydratase large subunit